MRHRNHKSRLTRPRDARRALLRALLEALILNERILTTEAKAKVLRPLIERLVTLGKKGELHHRRLAFARLQKKNAVHKLFTVIAPRFAERNGGYTRIVRAGQRQGDGAWMAYIEFVDFAPAAAPAAAPAEAAPATEPAKA